MSAWVVKEPKRRKGRAPDTADEEARHFIVSVARCFLLSR